MDNAAGMEMDDMNFVVVEKLSEERMDWNTQALDQVISEYYQIPMIARVRNSSPSLGRHSVVASSGSAPCRARSSRSWHEQVYTTNS